MLFSLTELVINPQRFTDEVSGHLKISMEYDLNKGSGNSQTLFHGQAVRGTYEKTNFHSVIS